MAARSQNSRTATKKRGRPSKKQQPEVSKSWSILLFGVGAVLLALTFIKGAPAWNTLSGWLFGLFGVITYAVAPVVLYLAFLIAAGRPAKAKLWQGALLLCFASALALIFSRLDLSGGKLWETFLSLGAAGQELRGGGLLSALIGWPLLSLCGRPAANVIIVVVVVVFFMLLTSTTPVDIYRFFREKASGARGRFDEYERNAAAARAAREERRRQELAEAAAELEAEEAARAAARGAEIDIPLGGGPAVPGASLFGGDGIDIPLDGEKPGPRDYGSAPPPPGIDMSAPFDPGPAAAGAGAGQDGARAPFDLDLGPAAPKAEKKQDGLFEHPAPDVEQLIKKAVAPRAEAAKPAIDPSGQVLLSPGAPGQNAYRYPPLDLFERGSAARGGADEAELKRNADLLVNTLASFGVQTKLMDISRGPSVTRYELQPAAGVKISRITGLADDIALNLAAAGVRIEAPIPGKAAVGIEVPNKHASAVDMHSILSSNEFKNSKSPIVIPLGKDIAGSVQVADLTKMPHLLIAGSTGSGKSVCINAIIISIVYRCSPEDVKMILIDPKVVELSDYNGIPHLLMPVVTEPRKASGALGSAVAEMERRYQLFAQNNVRDIKSYNKLAADSAELEHLPYIAIVIDELADLMMVAGKEVEDYICRIAQKARAAGMHLIVATQRPSVDVITGLIKANIPSRIAFAVSSQIDSRTILDGAGAEKLLGMGDMLFMPVGANKPVRIQGTYVKDGEITAVIDYVKQDNAAQYDENMISDMEKYASAPSGKGTAAGDGEDSDAHDPMLQAAIETVIEANMASTSLLQRKLKLGYARAARIMDTMEELHVIGPYEGSKPRTVLISRQQFIKMFTNGSVEETGG